MRITYETRAAPGAANEDYVVAGPDWAVVLDGATAPKGVDSGCRHDVAWLVHRLAGALSARLADDAGSPADVLAGAIEEVCAAHAGICDLANPDSPSSTVTIVRLRGETLECLALADSPIAVRYKDKTITVVDDDRTGRLPGGRPYTRELVRAHRNRPGGFWVASTEPKAAYEAVTVRFPVGEVAAVGMFTDGVTRLIEWYGYDWPRLFEELRTGGPTSVINSVRQAERACPLPYGKPHDDATAVLMTMEARR